MDFLTALWLPILLSGIALFFASFVAWMILPHHQNDWTKLDKEDEVMDAVRNLNIPPGTYMFPYCAGSAEMKSEEFQKRYKDGPRGTLNLWEVPNMGTNMACTFVFFLITSALIAYVTYIAHFDGGEAIRDKTFWSMFRISGTIGIIVHASSGILNGIWFKRKMVTDIIDGIVYGLIIGLIFGLLG